VPRVCEAAAVCTMRAAKTDGSSYRICGEMSSKLANKASHPSGRKAMQAVRASHKEERMKLHKIGRDRS
jgi:hypothetical protein